MQNNIKGALLWQWSCVVNGNKQDPFVPAQKKVNLIIKVG